MVVDGDEVDEEGGAADEGREQEGRDHHLPDPVLAAHPGIEAATGVTVDRSRGRVDEDGRAQQRSAPVQVSINRSRLISLASSHLH